MHVKKYDEARDLSIYRYIYRYIYRDLSIYARDLSIYRALYIYARAVGMRGMDYSILYII